MREIAHVAEAHAAKIGYLTPVSRVLSPSLAPSDDNRFCNVQSVDNREILECILMGT